jgi:protein-disulfide isomerase
LIYKHFPLSDIHPDSLPTAKAVWAAGQQGEFWTFHDALFERKDNLSDRLYQTIATQLKLDLEQFERDRQSEAATQAIAQDTQVANTLKIDGTPSFLVVDSHTAELVPGANLQALEARVQRSLSL